MITFVAVVISNPLFYHFLLNLLHIKSKFCNVELLFYYYRKKRQFNIASYTPLYPNNCPYHTQS